MPLATAPSFPALGWAALRSLGSVKTSHGETRTTIQRDKDHETTFSTWPAGGRSEVHGHDASETWTYVVSGEVEEERWTKSDLGEWSYESRLVRTGERSHLPAGALHRVKALADASVMSVYSPAPSGANERVPWSLLPSLRAARWRAGVVDVDEE